MTQRKFLRVIPPGKKRLRRALILWQDRNWLLIELPRRKAKRR